ncbi:pseudaminic acid biosynthesis-associated methylase [Salidesulfovibrio onnuriiensis]|uniref:pseudaminic acid biosynthesis-associated methylase n=1 Tax=Salidesulfovibrio onnuriiensis TaxID=2583823 RepID=UPI0011CB04D9|nr:pseudaminic acid biosynthesis-associated methylase [Salidesulfovibrio onnuriiensis]
MSIEKETSAFWKGEFGDEYVQRHDAPRLVPAKRFQFQTMLRNTHGISSIMELGTNQGFNLKVLHEQFPEAELHGVEINENAAAMARKVQGVESITCASLLEVPVDRVYDLSFTAGVLIHIAPEVLPKAYQKLYDFSRKFILLSEYHNTSPQEIEYRGHRNRMFMRDFAGELLDSYADLRLLDYGFFYKRDPRYGLGDINWFLMEKG